MPISRVFLILSTLLALTQFTPARAEEISKDPLKLYVSPKGSDTWSGRLREPNREKNDGPLATFAGARDAVRSLKGAGKAVNGVTVLFRTGTYALEDTVVLGPQDSGTENAPIVYSAYTGERPVISGGREIKGWIRSRLGKKMGREMWEAHLPEVKEGDWWFRELFVEGKRQPRTRLPKQGFHNFTSLVESPGKHEWSEGVWGAGFAPGNIQNWKNLQDVEIVALTRWIESRSPIASVNIEGGTVTFKKKSTFRLEDTKHPDRFAPYYVENIWEELDEPGEWYLDRGAGILYYLPRPGEGPRTLEVVAPRLSRILGLEGAEGNPVHDIRFEGLTFRYAEWEYPEDDAGSNQAAHEVPGALRLEHATRCAFERCKVERVGIYGIEIGPGCSGISVARCTIRDLGAGGVKMGHGSKASALTDCVLEEGGRIYPSAVGVWIGNSGHNRVEHNEIRDFYYTGISVGWTWGYGESNAIENKIEYNHIHKIGQGLLSDMGGIYSLGISPGTRLSHNLIHDVTSYDYGGWGIYPDEGSSRIVIENNVVHHTKTGGFHQHYGKENIVRNNIFALAHLAQIIRTREEEHKSFDFVGNIVYFTEGELLGSNWKNDKFFLDKNLYWNPDSSKVNFKGATLEEWRKRGHDLSSRIADPLFADPEKGDFTLKPESPAFELDFQPIDLSTVGPRN
ncbi:MAG: right-handed parallel beta-helix repeat-containing protein [Candidatus Omnitrophica bacterium]|nr:right-handed parallel beta-helix repeat-containing protein [Candidatus Omnitrophota bacterium]